MNKQKIDEKKQPKIKIGTILFPDIKVNRQPDIKADPEFDIAISNSHEFDEEKSMLQVNLRIAISETGSETSIIDITGVGIFQIEKVNTIDTKKLTVEYFAEHNAPAIIYPYLREYVSYISIKAGLNPILLPVTNFHAIADMKEKNKQNKD